MSVYHVTSFAHLTVDSGHSTIQTRDGIDPETTGLMKDGALGGKLSVRDLLFECRPIAGGWTFRIGEARRSPSAMVLCHLAAPGGGAAVWAAARADREARGLGWPTGIAMPRSAAWLSVSFLPGMLKGFRFIHMLGDAERCFAWTLFDHGTPGRMAAAA